MYSRLFTMNETEFKSLLNELDGFYLPQKIGLSDNTWVTAGRLCNNITMDDIKAEAAKLNADVTIHGTPGNIYIRFEEKDDILFKLPKIPRINVILFLLTILTTLFAGALMEGANLIANPWSIISGIPFSFTLLLILGTHEFGHYYFARKHRVDATLPYFIPAPTFIGTFGAFIKIKSPIYRKQALLHIGAAGPIAGFLVALPALIIGLYLSDVVEITGNTSGITLGDSLLVKFLSFITHPGLADNQDLMLHPVAFAGWIGLLVTMLNLLPIGQLDGGHVAYAMFGRKHDLVAKIAFLALIPLSILSPNWLVWGLLIILLMRTTKHPPVMDVDTPLDDQDKWIGYACLAIFILCFIPNPFPM